jgi:hypothetical protein
MSKDSKLTRVKASLAKNPKLTADTIVKHMGVNKVYAYNLLSKARSELGMVKHGGTWKLKERMQGNREFPNLSVATALHETPPPSPAVAKLAEQVVEVENLIEKHYGAKQTALDVQVGGDHYKNLAIQPVEFCEKNKLSHLESSIVKRVCRWRTKDGLKDLLKIKHEVDLLIELNGLEK